TAARIERNATGLLLFCRMTRPIPVAGPFPRVADHVVKAIAVWRKRIDRRRVFVSGACKILPGKLALPIVRHSGAGRSIVAPGKLRGFKSTPGSELPFRFGRQGFSRPRSVSLGVWIRDMHYRMVIETIERTLRAIGMSPVRTAKIGPPIS